MQGRLRWLRPTVLTIGTVLLAWQIAVAGIGEALVRDDRPAEAQSVDQLSGTPWSVTAATRLAAIDAPGAVAAARQALRRNPLDQRALTVLAVAGPPGQTSRLMELSATLGWRYQIAQIWLAQAGMAIGDKDLAATRIDAFARTSDDPVLAWPLVDAAVARATTLTAMAERLAAMPNWRSSYLIHPDDGGPGESARERLLAELARLGAPATRAELLPYVHILETSGRIPAARRIWARFAALPGAWSGLLYDGRFAHVGDGASAFDFEWVTQDAAGGGASADDAGGLALQNDGSADATLVHQMLMLAPGRYRLRVAATSETGSAAPPGFAWFVRCAETDLLDGSGAGDRALRAGEATYAFTVPASCPAETIAIDATPGTAGDSSSAHVRSVRLERVG